MLGGIAERFLSAGQEHSNVGYAYVGLDISDFPTRHNYVLALWQSDFERILAEWVAELGVPILRRCEVMGFAQDDSGVDVGLSDGTSLRAEYFVGCDGGRSVSRQAASYRHGRVLLAGDAAHGHSPQGGQGLNTGVQDAVNLGWKLAQVVNRTSPECLLDSYHAERHPVGARVLHNTMAQVALSSPDDRHKALLATMTEVLSMDEPRRRIAG